MGRAGSLEAVHCEARSSGRYGETSRINELNRLLAPPLIAILLVSGMASTASASYAASPAAVPSCEKEHGSPKDRPIPPGQLNRRGVIGSFAGVDDSGNILVETQFGVVAIAPPEGFDATTVEEGSRIAAHLDKEPLAVEDGTPTGTDTPLSITATDTPFRTGSALRIKVLPTEVTRSHDRGVIVGQEGDTVEVVDEGGEVENFEVTGDGGVQVPPEEEGDTTEPVVEQEVVEAGTDAILLTQCAGPGAKAEVRSIQRAEPPRSPSSNNAVRSASRQGWIGSPKTHLRLHEVTLTRHGTREIAQTGNRKTVRRARIEGSLTTRVAARRNSSSRD